MNAPPPLLFSVFELCNLNARTEILNRRGEEEIFINFWGGTREMGEDEVSRPLPSPAHRLESFLIKKDKAE